MKFTSLILFFLLLLCFVFSCSDKDSDTVAPVIELYGDSLVYSNLDSTFIDPGYKATDDVDGDITTSVKVGGTVNIHAEGTYNLRYNVKDAAGNSAIEKTRVVKVLIFK
ncbi:MAG: DUF5011 domain-containing protein [Bacteroidales bacterium]|nr:DUF5011 domain-containing protein [Bacteroidales bacterium]